MSLIYAPRTAPLVYPIFRAEALELAPLGGGQDDAPRVQAAANALAYLGTVVLKPGVWSWQSSCSLSAGAWLEGTSGARVIATITPIAYNQNACFLGRFTTSHTGALASANTFGTYTLSLNYKPTVGQYLRVGTEGLDWRFFTYRVVAASGSVSPFTVTVDRPVLAHLASGLVCSTLATFPRDIRIHGNGMQISGPADRYFEFINAWNCEISGIVQDSEDGCVTDMVGSFDEGSYLCRWIDCACDAPLATCGWALEICEASSTVRCVARNTTLVGIALYDCTGCSVDQSSGTGCVIGVGLISENDAVGCLACSVNQGTYVNNSMANALVRDGSTDCKLIAVASIGGADGVVITDGAVRTQVLGGSATGASTYGLRIGEKSANWISFSGGNVNGTIATGFSATGNGVGGIANLQYAKETRLNNVCSKDNGNGTSTGIGIKADYEELWVYGYDGSSGNCARIAEVTNGATLHLGQGHIVYSPSSPDNGIVLVGTNAIELYDSLVELGQSCNGINLVAGTLNIRDTTIKKSGSVTGTEALVTSGGRINLGGGVDLSNSAVPLDISSTGTVFGAAFPGFATIPMTSANHTATWAEYSAGLLVLSGTLGAGRDLVLPNASVPWTVKNGADQTVTVKGSSGTGVAITAGTTTRVIFDGTNFVTA